MPNPRNIHHNTTKDHFTYYFDLSEQVYFGQKKEDSYYGDVYAYTKANHGIQLHNGNSAEHNDKQTQIDQKFKSEHGIMYAILLWY